MTASAPHADNVAQEFTKHWQNATADSNLTLHGFRRFKTSHLINLRYLEEEMAVLDNVIYEAGLSLDLSPSSEDRLALRYRKRDKNAPLIEETITRETILKLRSLIKEYDEAVIAFNNIMVMETFSLLDDEQLSSQRKGFNLYEIYNTRLIRTDAGTRARTDPFQRRIHKLLRYFRYWRLSRNYGHDSEASRSSPAGRPWSYQDMLLMAEVAGRAIAAITIGVFLLVPLAIIFYQPINIQIAAVSVFILSFSLIVGAMMKVSNLEMMAVTAAYAAVLATFISNSKS